MEDVKFKAGGIGPFDGKIRTEAGGDRYTLTFTDARAKPEHFDALHQITVFRDGQPDLLLRVDGKASFDSKDQGVHTSGTLQLRPR